MDIESIVKKKVDLLITNSNIIESLTFLESELFLKNFLETFHSELNPSSVIENAENQTISSTVNSFGTIIFVVF